VKLFGGISYGLAAAAFLLLSLLLLTSARERSPGMRVIAAALITAAWAAAFAVGAALASLPPFAAYMLEMLRDAAWLVALVELNRAIMPLRLVWLARGLSAGLLALGPLLLVADPSAYLDASAWPLVRGGLVMAIFGLVVLEQLYRNAGASTRWALRPLLTGMGLLFAYDLYLYSQAELFKGIEPEAWAARGMVDMIAVPLLAIAARRSPDWSLDVFVSRQAVFYAGTCLAAGVYLMGIAAVGFTIRSVGGVWGGAVQIVFIAGAIAVLVLSLGSVELRRRVRVFIATHFYRNKYDYRIEWLRFVSRLSQAGGDDPRRAAVQAIAEIFESPGGALYLADERGQSLQACAAWPARLEDLRGLQELPAASELFRYLERTRSIIDLAHWRRSPGHYENVALPEWLHGAPRWRVLMPILQQERFAGLLLLEAPPGVFELTDEDRDLMRVTGQHVAVHIAQQEADRRLSDARQFEAYNRLAAFMMHDLKNSAAQMQLIVANAQRHRQNPAFIDDALETIANAVARINGLIRQIKGENAPQAPRALDLDALVREAARRCADRAPAPRLLEVQALQIRADPQRFAAVLEHVIRNAQDATPADGRVEVSLRRQGGDAQLTVQDSGCGMDAEFVRERLFRPFDSTKGAQGMGIGAYQAREYVRALGGDVEVSSATGAGTRFRMTVPLAPAASAAPDALDAA
jgi:putative PEP-CTERM system histidine kinase